VEEIASPNLSFAHWRVAGRVQGVGFRWFVLQAAERHAIRGDVRNLPDGRVEIRAVGHAEQLAAFREEATLGPPGARVDRVQQLEPDATLRFRGFDIRR
jgi:acylphosphatase